MFNLDAAVTEDYKWSKFEMPLHTIISFVSLFWLRATVLAYGWNTFIVLATGAKPISGAVAFGLAIVVGMATRNVHAFTKRSTNNPWLKLAEDLLIMSVAWLIMWITWVWFV